MLSLLKLLFLMINIDQKTVLHWFGLEESTNQRLGSTIENSINSNASPSPEVSLETFRLVIEGLWEKIQMGLSLSDIENVLFFILFIRFIILTLKFNLKTSFYITCIGLFAGYLWYRHLIDLILMYRNVLLKLPFLNSLGMDAVQMRSLNRQMALTEVRLGDNTHWYNPGQILYYAITKGVIHIDSETGLRYYRDPFSMVVSNLQEPYKSNVIPIYYKIYNKILPKIYEICSKFWNQLSGVAAYAVITRIGKRYCPYLIRWHWTLLLIIGLVEQIFIYFIYRVYYFQTFVLIPQAKAQIDYIDPSLTLQINIVNGIIAFVVLAHIGFIIFALFHAIWGQYFYVPFFVENTELHIGPRPKNSIYSGGQTAWQDSDNKNVNRLFPKLWFGWFGRGSKGNGWFIPSFLKFMKKFYKMIQKQFKN